jgi:Ca2+-binding EF-hand superfamily protein
VQEIKEEKVNLLMRLIDTNGSGQIDFTEFITATYAPSLLTAEHFAQAFNYFDIDHSGSITYD